MHPLQPMGSHVLAGFATLHHQTCLPYSPVTMSTPLQHQEEYYRNVNVLSFRVLKDSVWFYTSTLVEYPVTFNINVEFHLRLMVFKDYLSSNSLLTTPCLVVVTSVSLQRPGFDRDLWWTKWHKGRLFGSSTVLPCQCLSTA